MFRKMPLVRSTLTIALWVALSMNLTAGGAVADDDAAVDTLELLERLHAERLISDAVLERRRDRLSRAAAGATFARAYADPVALRSAKATTGTEARRRVALVVGSDAYARFEPLETARADARAVAARLHDRFGFDVQLLEDATRADLFTALSDLRETLVEQDDFVLFYAGHGHLDGASGRGYWLPIDASPEDRSNWVSNADVGDALRALRSRHVLVLSDACFSGSLAGADGRLDTRIASTAEPRSRTLIASGGLEPVLDTVDGRHSVFTNALLRELDQMHHALSVSALFERLHREVTRQADQTPQHAVLPQAGHVAGELVLSPRRR